jgi:histone acetyltransferase (RNA polymerase elongator complex component)
MIVPVFLPHLGCGHRCTYCNQNHITEKVGLPDIEQQLASLFADLKAPVEVALYGGNPPALQPHQLERLFRFFEPYSDRILSFRLSAKPVTMEKGVLDLLKKQRVGTIELGIPSFNDAILSALERGHTAREAIETYFDLRDEGFQVGIQVMVGLPGEKFDDIRETTARVEHLSPYFIRIYPLLVIEDTPLLQSFKQGQFVPDSLEKAVGKAAYIYVNAWKLGIRTVKMGLTENDVLKKKIAAGPYHPAFGYLVKSAAFLLALLERCSTGGIAGEITVHLHESDLPHLTGLRRANMVKLEHQGIVASWAIDNSLTPGHFAVEMGARRITGSLTDALSAFDSHHLVK